MNIDSLDGGVVVTLSRKNLTELLASLDTPELRGAGLRRRTANGVLVVRAETDEQHYGTRPEGGPGLGFAPWLGAGTGLKMAVTGVKREDPPCDPES